MVFENCRLLTTSLLHLIFTKRHNSYVLTKKYVKHNWKHFKKIINQDRYLLDVNLQIFTFLKVSKQCQCIFIDLYSSLYEHFKGPSKSQTLCILNIWSLFKQYAKFKLIVRYIFFSNIRYLGKYKTPWKFQVKFIGLLCFYLICHIIHCVMTPQIRNLMKKNCIWSVSA